MGSCVRLTHSGRRIMKRCVLQFATPVPFMVMGGSQCASYSRTTLNAHGIKWSGLGWRHSMWTDHNETKQSRRTEIPEGAVIVASATLVAMNVAVTAPTLMMMMTRTRRRMLLHCAAG